MEKRLQLTYKAEMGNTLSFGLLYHPLNNLFNWKIDRFSLQQHLNTFKILSYLINYILSSK